jgi:3,4-dihydroxy 2-butanone 4-phosphate synthase/GTP cyclohydrolase II
LTTPSRHRQEDVLRHAPSTSDSIAELLENLTRARARPRRRDRPFVTLAYAQSLDGSITTARGARYGLSGPEALQFTHTLRARHDAILIGVGTVLADDPELRVRLADGPSPLPVIVDSRVRTPNDAKLLSRPGRPVWIATTSFAGGDGREQQARVARIQAEGRRIIDCPALPNGWVDLAALLRRLGSDGVENVMVEGGARIITSFLVARLVDYAVITIAPQFLGGLPAVDRSARVGLPAAVASLTTAWVSCRLGDDLVLGGEVAWPAG